MRLFPVLVFLVATDTSGEWPIIKCWLLSNKLKKNFAEKAESKISRATHKECKLQRNADRRDWKACCQLTLHLVWAYGYLRCTGTSFSSRVFHQLVGFSTKSAQIKSWKFKWANSLRASSPIWASEASLASEGPREGFAARSRVLARLVPFAQIGELARRLFAHLNFQLQNLNFTSEFNILHSSFRVHVFGKRFYTCLLAFELNCFI